MPLFFTKRNRWRKEKKTVENFRSIHPRPNRFGGWFGRCPERRKGRQGKFARVRTAEFSLDDFFLMDMNNWMGRDTFFWKSNQEI